MSHLFFAFNLLLVSAVLGLNCNAAEKPAHQFSDWSFGPTVFGDPVDMDKTKGSVVVVEYWGVRCPPCIASLPHLAKLDKRYKDDGLIIIGAESQGSSKQQMEPLLKKAKVNYTITQGARGPITVSGIPRALVFNRAGNLIYDGHPAGRTFDSAIKKALKEKDPTENASTETPPSKDSALIQQQSWTNSDGKTIRAAVLKADDSTVTFRLPNGRSIQYPLDQLSEESQSTIQEALK